MDCFVAPLATTASKHTSTIPPPDSREVFQQRRAIRKSEDAGKCRGRAAPAVSCASLCERNAHEHTGSAETPGIPCAMVLRLITRSSRRRIPLATVIRGLKVLQNPVGPHHLRGLGTSNGCQNHTPSPSASAPFVSVSSDGSRSYPPCHPIPRLTPRASTASRPTSVTIASAPLAGRDGGSSTGDLGGRHEEECFRRGGY